MPTFEQGRIIWAVISDARGVTKPDPRPAMVMSTVTVKDAGDLIPVIVGSTKFQDPPVVNHIIIHNSYQVDRATKLRRPTALICDWLAEVRLADVHAQGGFLPARRAIPIVEKALTLQHHKGPPDAP